MIKRKNIKLPINIILLEDEIEILDDLRYEMNSSLSNFHETCISPDFDHEVKDSIQLIANIKGFDNIDDARKRVHTGNCDILIADYRVKEKANSKKATASALPLLNEIKNKNGFIHVIGHTAYTDLLNGAIKDNLAHQTIQKTEKNNMERLIKEGSIVTKEIGAFKGNLFGVFSELKSAFFDKNLIDKQQKLEKARSVLAGIQTPKYAPSDYQRTIVMLRSMIYRISSVPSEKFQLNSLSEELVDKFELLIEKLKNPFFSFKRDALSIFMELEAIGYNVIMRIEDE